MKSILVLMVLCISGFASGCITKHVQYYSGELTTEACEAIDQYAEKVAQEHKMELLSTEGSLIRAHFTEERNLMLFSLAYASHKELSLDEGRRLIANLITDFIAMLKECPGMDKFTVCYSMPYTPDDSSWLLLDYIGYKLSFWDQDMNRVQKPYLAEIVLYKGMIRYYTVDSKTSSTVLCFEESYEDAVEFAKKATQECSSTEQQNEQQHVEGQ